MLPMHRSHHHHLVPDGSHRATLHSKQLILPQMRELSGENRFLTSKLHPVYKAGDHQSQHFIPGFTCGSCGGDASRERRRRLSPVQQTASVVKPSSLCFSDEELSLWARHSALICCGKRACNVALHANHSELLNKRGVGARTDTLVTMKQ